MQLEKQDLSHLNQPYPHNAERLLFEHILAGGLLLGRVGELRTRLATYRYGCQNTLMPRLVGGRVIFTNTALLCRSILVDHSKAMSLSITRMALKTITELRTLSCLLRMFIEGMLYAPTVIRSL